MNFGSYEEILALLKSKVPDYPHHKTLAAFIYHQVNDKFIEDSGNISNFIGPLTGAYHQVISEALGLL